MDNQATGSSRVRQARSGVDASLDRRTPDGEAQPHTILEDAYALCVGTALLSLGLVILAKGGLVTGGAAGLALMLSYLTGRSPGLFILLLTAPFLLLAAKVMGRPFAAKTLVVSVGVLAMTALAPRGIEIVHVSGSFVALIGGSLIGMGALALARGGDRRVGRRHTMAVQGRALECGKDAAACRRRGPVAVIDSDSAGRVLVDARSPSDGRHPVCLAPAGSLHGV